MYPEALDENAQLALDTILQWPTRGIPNKTLFWMQHAYEDGMDYARICRIKTREGEGLIIMGGVSVTRTLPHGTPDDVRRELRRLVENGPETGLFLGASSSITPGVPWKNIETLVEGLAYYRTTGRS